MSKDVQAAIVIVAALIVLVLARLWQLNIYKQRGLGKPRWFGLGRRKEDDL
jgi:hypothetical protein